MISFLNYILNKSKLLKTFFVSCRVLQHGRPPPGRESPTSNIWTRTLIHSTRVFFGILLTSCVPAVFAAGRKSTRGELVAPMALSDDLNDLSVYLLPWDKEDCWPIYKSHEPEDETGGQHRVLSFKVVFMYHCNQGCHFSGFSPLSPWFSKSLNLSLLYIWPPSSLWLVQVSHSHTLLC